MSLQEIFHKVQGWVAELWNHHPPLETLLFWAALIISVMAAINALAVSTSTSGNWKDNSDAAQGPQRREATRRFDAPVQREYFNAERELSYQDTRSHLRIGVVGRFDCGGPRAQESGRFGGHIGEMTNALAGMPMVEVTAPDGSKELWAVASARHYAVGIVQKLVPPGHIARPSSSRVPMSEEMDSLNWGEARRVKP